MLTRPQGARSIRPPLSGSVVAIGTFDGVHIGHRALIDRAVENAHRQGVPAVVYTFHPHPAKVLAPNKAPPLLMTLEERARAIEELGVDQLVIEPFDAAFSQVDADDWVQRYLLEALRPKSVIVGFNFSYGRGRGGDPRHLTAAGARLGFHVETIGSVQLDGEVVSSTTIRARIQSGDVEHAARMLGRRYALRGRVEVGDRRGRTLQFPTANLAIGAEGPEVLPAHGVYATFAELEDRRRFMAVTNIGVRPTFDGASLRIEAHLLGFEGDLYGQHLRLELAARVREERRFSGPEALVAQIREDVSAARRLLEQP
jgi:riboflavin kinase/FMN adenylyltransferase